MKESKNEAKSISIVGFVITGIWLVALPSYVLHFMGWTNFSKMTPNEFGDFLAGAAAPLAFFWLVIGFLLQRKELELQRKELALQRKETERLADEAGKQAASIAANEEHARKDTFFRFADMVHSEQQSICSAFFSEFVGRGLGSSWDEISDGDSDFFFRTIVRAVFPERVDKAKQRIQTNKFVESSSKKFIENFRNLIAEAEKCDPDKIIIKHYEFGWMGHLYAGLCVLTGDQCNFRTRKEPTGPEDIY